MIKPDWQTQYDMYQTELLRWQGTPLKAEAIQMADGTKDIILRNCGTKVIEVITRADDRIERLVYPAPTVH